MQAVDRVLGAAPPPTTEREAVVAAEALYGVTADRAVDFGSERDRTFALRDRLGQSLAVLKVSNDREGPEILDMEAEAALWVGAVDAELNVPIPRRARAFGSPRPGRAGDPVQSLRASHEWEGRTHAR